MRRLLSYGFDLILPRRQLLLSSSRPPQTASLSPSRIRPHTDSTLRVSRIPVGSHCVPAATAALNPVQASELV